MPPPELAQISEIYDFLYLSGAHPVQTRRMRNLGITNIINATMEVSDLRSPGLTTMHIYIDDSPYAKISPYFDKCAKLIHDVKARGGKTLVHCIAGVSRSASLIMAYLIKYQSMSLRQAYDFLKTKREIVHPNTGFFRQLITFEREVRGAASVAIVRTPWGAMPSMYKKEIEEWQQAYARALPAVRCAPRRTSPGRKIVKKQQK